MNYGDKHNNYSNRIYLKHCKSSAKWNIYEVIIFLAIMDFIRPKFDPIIFAKILQTKSPEQCEKFYQKHFAFLKQASSIQIPNDRIETIRMYMRLPEFMKQQQQQPLENLSTKTSSSLIESNKTR
ncbi:hypothetical protein BLA29_012122 [Euroglyphus maynei]|uniref:SANT domain-containing protein n=1 Tax=Euroglyphus maynei TaxID=6958 RepID=A0A1Y3BQW7_EURMA|nr:hypothetical protein BLA29_012122 [Euroglyphus maynei]